MVATKVSDLEIFLEEQYSLQPVADCPAGTREMRRTGLSERKRESELLK